MKVLKFTISLFQIFMLSMVCGQKNEISLENANTSYFQMKPKLAKAQYQAVWNDTTLPMKDRVMAAQRLATMHWHLYDNSEAAYKILEQLEQINESKSKDYAIWSRILREEENFEAAIITAQKCYSNAQTISEKYLGQITIAKAIFEKYQHLILEGKLSVHDSLSVEFKEAYELLQEVSEKNPGDIELAKIYLGMSIIADHPKNIYAAWLSFYRAGVNGDVSTFLKPANNLLKVYAMDAELEEQSSRKDLINGLADSGFIEHAVLAIKYAGIDVNEGTRHADLLHYYNFLQTVKRETTKFYHSSVLENSNKSDYDNRLRAAGKKLWVLLSWKNKDQPELNDRNLLVELNKRFNTVGRLMKANGFYGLSLGHKVLDETRKIEQYGKVGELQYIAIDHMVSNGYSSWFWDGRAEIGGWAPDESSILHVRSAYSHGPISAWFKVSDSVEIKKTKNDIIVNSKKDDELARKNPYAYLPGLSKRISYNSLNKVYEKLRSNGLEGQALRSAFINSYERLKLESSIFAHEGRHAIDKKLFKNLSSEELEFRAKLSEIYFSEEPFMAINAIISQNIGDGTPHGNANKRVLKGIVKWMEKNVADITNFDSSRPFLPQLDLLTDEQLKIAVNSFDPLVKN